VHRTCNRTATQPLNPASICIGDTAAIPNKTRNMVERTLRVYSDEERSCVWRELVGENLASLQQDNVP